MEATAESAAAAWSALHAADPLWLLLLLLAAWLPLLAGRDRLGRWALGDFRP